MLPECRALPRLLGLPAFEPASLPKFPSFGKTGKCLIGSTGTHRYFLQEAHAAFGAEEFAVRKNLALLLMGLTVGGSLVGCNLCQRNTNASAACCKRVGSPARVPCKCTEVASPPARPVPPAKPLPKPAGEKAKTSGDSTKSYPYLNEDNVTPLSAPALPVVPQAKPRPVESPKNAAPPLLAPQPTAPPVLPPAQGVISPLGHVESVTKISDDGSIIILKGSSTPFAVKPARAEPKKLAIAPSAAQPSTSLNGQVETWRKTRRLRYAAIDADDPHGGSVTLVGDQVDRLQDGQNVRVQGRMILSDDRTAAPRFVVQSVQIMP